MKKVAILSNPYLETSANIHQERRIREEFEARGVRAEIVKNANLLYLDGGVKAFGALLENDFFVNLDKDKYVPRLLERLGKHVYNSASAVEICDDKMATHIALADVPMPKTIPAPLCYLPDAPWQDRTEEIVEKLGLPVVVKECYGSRGVQVYLAETRQELRKLSFALRMKAHLYQEFIAESRGRDVRVLTVGGEIVAAMERRSDGDFRSNIGLGGHGVPFAPDDRVRELCRKISEILRLDYCGIDLLMRGEEFLVCEVNSNAYFEGLEGVTGKNVAGEYVTYLCKKEYEC